MKSVKKMVYLLWGYLPVGLALCTAIIFFVAMSSYFVTEKSTLDQWSIWITSGSGFLGGLLGGGILGWLIGGIGIAALGTAVGVASPVVIVIGGVAGAVFGTLSTSAYNLYRVLENPRYYTINWLVLCLSFLGGVVIYFVVKWVFVRIFPEISSPSGEQDQTLSDTSKARSIR